MENLKYSEILKGSKMLSDSKNKMLPYKVAILSNISLNQLKVILEYYLLTNDISPEVAIGNYDNIVQDSYLDYSSNNMVLIHYDLYNILDKLPDFQEKYDDSLIDSLVRDIITQIDLIITNLSYVPSLVFDTFSSYSYYSNPIKRSVAEKIALSLNGHLHSIKRNNLTILNIDEILMINGLNSSLDFKMFAISKSLYTVQYLKEYVYALSVIIFKNAGKQKKAIIFDCDGTLWRGILGEDGENGIDMASSSHIGSIYNKIQKIAVWLADKGVIIGLCSKNNAEDVEHVLSTHKDMVLKNDAIVIKRVNWDDKATNLLSIAKELNIGLDSIVFVDDSSFEINLVRERIPSILTFQVPSAIHNYPNAFLKFLNRYFYIAGDKSDIEKTKQYKQQVLRNEEKCKFHSLDEYVASLNITLDVYLNDSENIPRLSQLTQKTNQFNLTTKRYTEHEIEELINSNEYIIYSIKVSDKFGDTGITGLAIININDDIALIDSFIMSCRIMGRNIEYVFIDYILKMLFSQGINHVSASYCKTAKNAPVAEFYDKAGFATKSTNEKGDKGYILDISDYKQSTINYISINNG